VTDELKYDPELPFVVRVRFSQELLGRFSDLQDAEQIAGSIYGGYDTEVIDTTPKPKIPDDAEFVYYMSWANSAHYAKRVGHPDNHVWETSNPTSQVSEEDLLIRIGDAEVTVLVRKEES